MQPTAVISFGDEEFPLAHVTVQEMAKVKSWTQLRNRRDWFDAIGKEDPEALLAAFVLVKQRRGEDIRFSSADFDLDDLSARLVDDDGREVEPVFEKKADGTVKTDKDGAPVATVDSKGNPQYVYADTGEAVPTGA